MLIGPNSAPLKMFSGDIVAVDMHHHSMNKKIIMKFPSAVLLCRTKVISSGWQSL